MQLGRFALVRPLARGGMGTVWLAKEPRSGLEVALKWLPTATAFAASLLEAELRATASLVHPHVVRVFDAGRATSEEAEAPEAAEAGLASGVPWFAMELLGSGPLPASRSWPEAKAALTAVLSALAHAHARGWVHCDIKPDNVLRDASGRVVVTDFGVARLLHPSGAQPSGGGTPQWAAPEQLSGEEWRIGPWTDLFAVGLLAGFLTSGSPSIPDSDLDRVRALHTRPIPIPEPAFEIPPGWSDWMARAVARQPAQRFRHAADALAALERLDEDATILLVRPRTDAPPEALLPPPPAHGRPAPELLPDATPELPDARYGVGVLRHRRLPVVGRQREQELLWRELRQVAAGRTRLVVLDGPPGTGKSVLGRWLVSQAHELGIARTFSARGHAGGDLAVDLLLDGLGRLRHAPVQSFAPLGLPFPDDLAALVSRRDGAQIPAARRVASALAALAEGRPLAVWLDDPDRSDAAPALLDALLALDRPKLVVLTQRSTVPPVQAPGVRISLGPLPIEPLTELVSRLAPLGAPLCRRLAQCAEGLPLVAMELAMDWLDRGVLRWSEGRWQLLDGVPLPVPGTLQRLLLARVDAALASARDRRALRQTLDVAAHLGTEVELEVLEDTAVALGLPPPPSDLLPRLCTSGLAVVAPGRPDRFSFAHDLLAEAIVDVSRDSAAIHRAAAEVWSRRGRPGQAHSAIHWAALGEREREAEALCEAAALWRNTDFFAAEALARRAVTAAEGTPQEPRAAVALAEVLDVLGKAPEMLEVITTALARIVPERDPTNAARLWALRANHAYHRDDLVETVRCARHAAELLPHSEPTERCRLLLRLSILMDARPAEGLQLTDAALECAPSVDLAAEARMFRAMHLPALGRTDEALDELEFVRAAMLDGDNLARRSTWRILRGFALIRLDRYAEAIPELLDALRLRVRMGSFPVHIACHAMHCALRCGLVEQAEQVIGLDSEIGTRPEGQLLLAARDVLDGRPDDAAEKLRTFPEVAIREAQRTLLQQLAQQPDPVGAAASALL